MIEKNSNNGMLLTSTSFLNIYNNSIRQIFQAVAISKWSKIVLLYVTFELHTYEMHSWKLTCCRWIINFKFNNRREIYWRPKETPHMIVWRHCSSIKIVIQTQIGKVKTTAFLFDMTVKSIWFIPKMSLKWRILNAELKWIGLCNTFFMI